VAAGAARRREDLLARGRVAFARVDRLRGLRREGTLHGLRCRTHDRGGAAAGNEDGEPGEDPGDGESAAHRSRSITASTTTYPTKPAVRTSLGESFTTSETASAAAKESGRARLVIGASDRMSRTTRIASTGRQTATTAAMSACCATRSHESTTRSRKSAARPEGP